MPMTINFRPSEDLVMIRLMRPITMATERILRDQDAPILPPPTPLSFSRAEWALLVSSGLLFALGVSPGWQDWDKATAFRAAEVTEKDHLLIVASLFLQGRNFGHEPYPPALAEAGEAIERLCRRAADYRRMEGIQTPIEPGPMPRIAHFHGGRLWFSNHDLPNPNFQAPLLEHAVDGTHVDVLIDLAKQLAQTLGVPAERLDDLWTGTVRRVKR
jgi:hypothetical protein